MQYRHYHKKQISYFSYSRVEIMLFKIFYFPEEPQRQKHVKGILKVNSYKLQIHFTSSSSFKNKYGTMKQSLSILAHYRHNNSVYGRKWETQKVTCFWKMCILIQHMFQMIFKLSLTCICCFLKLNPWLSHYSPVPD